MKLWNIYCALFLLVLLLAAGSSSAQRDPRAMLRQMQQEAAQLPISYDYQLRLVHAASGATSDSLRGRIYSSGKRYIDSSSRMLRFTDGQYYCSFNHATKQAYVYDLRVLARKTGTTGSAPGQALAGLPDTLLPAGWHIHIDSAGARYEIRIDAEEQGGSIEVSLRKTDLRLYACSIRMPEAATAAEEQYLRVCNSFAVRYDVDESIFASSRFFSLQKGKVILPRQYAHYQLIQMTR